MWIYLSHVLDQKTPAYGNGPSFSSAPEKSISKSDSSNTSFWRLPNHTGTHIDFPRHFSQQGAAAEAYPAQFWHFKKPHTIQVPCEGNQLIKPEDLSHTPEGTDILLIRTGFERFRGEESYWKSNPGLSPEAAQWIRKERPSVRAVGFDFISLSRWQDRDTGRKAHLEFLAREKPILLIEDMSLKDLDQARQVFVLPLIVRGADGSPCTILAEV